MRERLRVENLSVEFATGAGTARAVDGVSFDLGEGETLALVGESGCGKSMTCLALMRLLPSPPARLASGRAVLGGRDLFSLDEAEMRRVRGGELAMIFQEPMTSFDPVFTIGDQLLEAVLSHEPLGRGAALAKAEQALADVGLPNPKGVLDRYPHQLSGGMKQRAMIAMGIVENPSVVLCDEPTTALDVTIQAQILELLARLRDERGMSMLFITHNLGIVAGLAQRAAVMYAGRIVETAGVRELYADPLHPYTIGLFGSVPRLTRKADTLASIPGMVPGLFNRPAGCRFEPRCGRAKPVCKEIDPPLEDKGGGRLCACHMVEKARA